MSATPPRAPSLPGRRRIVFAGAAVVVTTLVFFFALEVGLRILRPDLHPESGNVLRSCHVFDPLAGWYPAPNCSGRFVKEDFDTTITTNAYGLRGAAVSVEAAPPIRRVAILGDSFAWGYGVNDDQTFAVHVQRRLQDSEVLNFGVCGYGTDQAYLRYREVARPFGARVVVLAFFAGNDFANNMEGRTRPKYRPYFAFDNTGILRAENVPLPPRPDVLATRKRGFDEYAQRWSFAYRFLYLKAKLLGAMVKDVPALARLRDGAHQRELAEQGRTRALPLYTADPPADTVESIAVTLGLLDLLREAVEADGARLILMLIPQRAEVDPAEWARALRGRNLDPRMHDPARPHRLVADWAAARGVPVLNLFEAFAGDPDARKYFLPTDRHFSVVGHERTAVLLVPLVRAALVDAEAAPHSPH